jgi:hypothetical protein
VLLALIAIGTATAMLTIKASHLRRLNLRSTVILAWPPYAARPRRS